MKFTLFDSDWNYTLIITLDGYKAHYDIFIDINIKITLLINYN